MTVDIRVGDAITALQALPSASVLE